MTTLVQALPRVWQPRDTPYTVEIVIPEGVAEILLTVHGDTWPNRQVGIMRAVNRTGKVLATLGIGGSAGKTQYRQRLKDRHRRGNVRIELEVLEAFSAGARIEVF